ncbi:hypothetical protein EHQ47_06775 [Leptospira bourretii]|uniref:hypothetical protein n=1 Tax=Leptospira bourretii TaxID=2484962 RepID=UPI001104C1DD|nr:hypothetical protein [Leptospira bourretii]TGL23569.1 hypothetical protein EHQ47_06775 [Leptospira bourretii]
MAKYLESKNYVINGYGYKKNAHLESVDINEKTDYSDGDLIRICSQPNLTSLAFKRTKVRSFSADASFACSKSNIAELAVINLTINKNELCNLVSTFTNKQLTLALSGIVFTNSDLECISKLKLLKYIAIPDRANISEESFCNFSKQMPQLLGIQLNNSTLATNGLNCILNFPSLRRVTLQNWNSVSEDEMGEWVKKYEKKYNRKLEAQIIDPVGYER